MQPRMYLTKLAARSAIEAATNAKSPYEGTASTDY
jgi:hypothetical protein